MGRNKERDSSRVFVVCLFVLPRGPPFFLQPVSSPSSFFSRRLNIFFLSVMCLPPVQAALSVSLSSDVSIKMNVRSAQIKKKEEEKAFPGTMAASCILVTNPSLSGPRSCFTILTALMARLL